MQAPIEHNLAAEGVRSSPSAPLAQALAHAETLLATNPGLALRQAQSILDAVPNHPQALYIMGAAYRRAGNTGQAAEVLGPLARTQPRAAVVHHEWALIQAALGHPQAAIASIRLALHLKPDLTQAWRALGDLHTLAGELLAADAAYAQHLRSGVNDPALRQAATSLCDNDLHRAERLLRTHLMAHPTDVAAIRMLAEAGTRLGRDADAEALLLRCLDLMPSFTAARYNLALVLFRQNKAEPAIPHLEKLLAADAADIACRNLLAASLAAIGDAGRAINEYERVVRQAPGEPKIWLSFGHVLKTAGHRAQAVLAYRTCLKLAPGFGEAWWSLANLKNEPFSDADLATLRQHLAAATTNEDRFHLHYTLGFALERVGDYATSFTHYADGARLRRTEVSYDADRTHLQMRRSRDLLTGDFFAAREGWGCQDASPIFIVGLPRSGSTLIEQILASHSAIEGTMELPEMVNIARDLRRLGQEDDRYPLPLTELDPAKALDLGQRYIDRTRIYRKLGKPYFIDKLPNNFVHIGLIQLILPRARIIDARRHPMAACFSAFKQHFARGQHFSYDLTDLGRYYTDYVALMDHFDQVLPGRIHRVAYDRMVEETEDETRRLLAYLGRDFEPGCLRFHENTRAVRTASSEQVRRPIYREGLVHWRHYAPWLGALEAALAPVLTESNA